jgi:signal transduction histidine kinase
VLEQIAESVARLAEADTVQVVLPVPDQEDTLEFAVSRGPGAELTRGLRYPAAGSIAEQAMHSPDGLVLTEVQDRVRNYGDARSRLHITDLMAFPLPRKGGPRGCVVVCRSNSQPFTPAEATMARAFTSQAALALELADARADRSRLDLLEDRERISRELQHDVLQQLFDTSLTMQSALAMTGNGVARAQLGRAVATLDDSIRNIRSSIFGLPRSQTLLTSVASRALAIIAQFTPALGFAPALQVVGALDSVVDQQLASELKAVLREALTVLAAHAPSHAATVQVSADAAEVSLTVTDDSGVLARTAPSAALLDLRGQAEQHRGSLDLDHGPGGGSLLRWSVPVSDRPAPDQLSVQ